MCGITGKIYFDNNAVSEPDILAMNEKIRHRGPDDGGIYISPDQKVGLGHRRLSIIDLSPLAHQPMNYLDRYWIVFNGEIYNYKELRKELETATPANRRKVLLRIKTFQGMREAKIRPEWMFLTHLPVLPPDLRPMVQLDGGRYASSDLNDLYRRVINRNNRLKKLLELDLIKQQVLQVIQT